MLNYSIEVLSVFQVLLLFSFSIEKILFPYCLDVKFMEIIGLISEYSPIKIQKKLSVIASRGSISEVFI